MPVLIFIKYRPCKIWRICWAQLQSNKKIIFGLQINVELSIEKYFQENKNLIMTYLELLLQLLQLEA